MAARWTITQAKAHFSHLVEDALRGEPQFVTRRGQDVAVVVSVQEYERLRAEKAEIGRSRDLAAEDPTPENE